MEEQYLLLFGASPFGVILAERLYASTRLKTIVVDDLMESANSGKQELSSAGIPAASFALESFSREALRGLFGDVLKSEILRHLVVGKSLSPWTMTVKEILQRNLYEKAAFLEAARESVTEGSSGVVLTSFSGSRTPQLTVEQRERVTSVTAEELLELEFLQPAKMESTFHAFQMSNACLEARVHLENTHWMQCGGFLRCISPGILTTSHSLDCLSDFSRLDGMDEALLQVLSALHDNQN